MADTGGENIGGINVSIGADYSPLQAAFNTAEDLAQQAGADIADALVSGAASAGNIGEEISSQLDQIGPAADGAGSALEGFAGDAGDAGEAAEESASKLAEMAEQLVAVGEALVITEGLSELITEALGAADAITHASIALTTITGSGDTAKETIEGLEQLGMSDGLAMPSLLSAATRMQQILGPATDVTEELKMVADGAAAMGTDIETAAQKFDQIASAGNASARTLTALGISLGGLATAFNTVESGADVTATTVAAAFKALDQSERIEVLNTALKTLGGTAEQVAEQTFGGQWQQLANAWEGIMVQVGQSILPIVSDLLSLTKTEIVPFLQGAVAEFSALPGPIKDVAAGVALAVVAVIPLTGALAALGLGLSGLQTLIPTITALSASFAGAAEAVAVAETAQAEATLAMGAAAAAAVPEVEALAVAEQQLSFGFASELAPAAGLVGEQLSLELLPAIEGVGTGLAAFTTDVGAAGLGLAAIGPITGLLVLSVASLKDGWNHAKDTLSNVLGTVEQLPGVLTSVSDAGGILGTVGSALHSTWSSVLSVFEQYNTYSLVAKGINEIVDAVDLFTGVVPGATQMTAAFSSELTKLQTAGTQSKEATDALAASFKAAALAALDGGNQLTAVQLAIGNIVTSQDKATESYKTALAAYQTLSNSLATGTAIYNGSAASANEVATAFKNLQTAASAAGVTLADAPGSMDAINAAATRLGSSLGFVVNAQQEEANANAVATSSLDLATTAYNTSVAKLDILKAQLDQVSAAYAAGLTPRSEVIAAEGNLQKAYAESQKAQTDLQTTATNYANTLSTSVDSAQKLELQALQSLAESVGPVMSAFLGLDGQIADLQSRMPGFGVVVSNISTGPLAGLQSALNEASAKVADLAQKMADGANVGQQYEKALQQQLNAQIALDQESAVLATGLQGATDAVSLATDAVAAAQAKLDDLTAAFQAGLPIYDKVQSAQKALTTAQNELNTAVGQSSPLLQAQTTAQTSLAPAVTTATSAITQQVTALQQQVTALNDVAAAVNSVEADMQAAFGTGSKSLTIGSSNSGQYYSGGLVTGAGEFGTQSTAGAFYDTPATAYKQALAAAQALMPAKGTSASALAQDALAQALAVLQVYQQFLGAGVGVTVQDIQSAQQAVTTAQAAVAAAGGGSSSSTSPWNAGLVVNPGTVNLSGLPGGVGGGSTTASTSTGSTIASNSGGGTSAVDGGSYPAVTAHQAVGEVWAVSASGQAATGGGGGGSIITTSISNTVTGGGSDGASLQAATQAIGTVAQQIAANSGDLLPISQSLLSTAAATQQLATAVAGLVVFVNSGGTNASGPAPTTTSTGTAYSVGGVTQTSPSQGGGILPGAPVSSAPVNNVPGFNPFGPGSTGNTTINVTVNAQGSIGMNQQQLNAQITSAVVNTLVPQLQTAGARLTR